MKQVNVIYPAHQGDKSVHYEGPEGTVWMSNTQDDQMPNVFTSWYACGNPRPQDNLIMLEPIVVHPLDYKIDFLKKFNKIFGCFGKVFENTPVKEKFIQVNYGSTLVPEDPDALLKRWKPWSERINGFVIVSGGKTSDHPASIYRLRLELADLLHKKNYPVAWYGGLPAGIKRPYFKGTVSDKIDEICKYRWHICPENTYDEKYSWNYLTEKLPHAIYGGAIPMYIGCYNVEQLVPPEVFFDLRRFVDVRRGKLHIKEQELFDAINNLTEADFNNYNTAGYKFMKDPEGLFFHTDMRRYYKKMLEFLP
jgi:hypothetical protein